MTLNEELNVPNDGAELRTLNIIDRKEAKDTLSAVFKLERALDLACIRKFIIEEQERRQINKELSDDPRGRWFQIPPPFHAYPQLVEFSDEMLKVELKR